jgi:hypothetical protein
MAIVPRSKLVVALLVIALVTLLCLPAAANATFAFNTNATRPEVWVSGHEDGTEPTYVGHGLVEQVSPDGKLLAYAHEAGFGGWELTIYNIATGRRWVRLNHVRIEGGKLLGESAGFAWSPDSTMLAVLQNDRQTHKQTLFVMSAWGGDIKTRIATGYFRGVSFSPNSKEVVFGLAHTAAEPAKTDIARAPVSGAPVTLLTHDGISGWPLWGPRGQIAFSKRSGAKQWKLYGEVRTRELFDLFVMKANGGRVKPLTTVAVYEAGFFPAFWLPSGGRLVANYESLEKNYAALVDPGSGKVTPINPPVKQPGGVGKGGFLAGSLTADGQAVLCCSGSMVDALMPPASVPIAGGSPTALNEDAYSPSWSGVPTLGAGAC